MKYILIPSRHQQKGGTLSIMDLQHTNIIQKEYFYKFSILHGFIFANTPLINMFQFENKKSSQIREPYRMARKLFTQPSVHPEVYPSIQPYNLSLYLDEVNIPQILYLMHLHDTERAEYKQGEDLYDHLKNSILEKATDPLRQYHNQQSVSIQRQLCEALQKDPTNRKKIKEFNKSMKKLQKTNYRDMLETTLKELIEMDDNCKYGLILALLWLKSTNRSQIITYYKELHKYNPKYFYDKGLVTLELTPLQIENGIYNENDTFEVALIKVYRNTKSFIQLLNYSTAFIKDETVSFSDCGETSLRNFIYIIKATKGLGMSVLIKMGAIEEVIDHFEKYETFAELNTVEARNEWAEITSNLENVNYNDTHNKCEIQSHRYELNLSGNFKNDYENVNTLNMINVIRRLFKNIEHLYSENLRKKYDEKDEKDENNGYDENDGYDDVENDGYDDDENDGYDDDENDGYDDDENDGYDDDGYDDDGYDGYEENDVYGHDSDDDYDDDYDLIQNEFRYLSLTTEITSISEIFNDRFKYKANGSGIIFNITINDANSYDWYLDQGHFYIQPNVKTCTDLCFNHFDSIYQSMIATLLPFRLSMDMEYSFNKSFETKPIDFDIKQDKIPSLWYWYHRIESLTDYKNLFTTLIDYEDYIMQNIRPELEYKIKSFQNVMHHYFEHVIINQVFFEDRFTKLVACLTVGYLTDYFKDQMKLMIYSKKWELELFNKTDYLFYDDGSVFDQKRYKLFKNIANGLYSDLKFSVVETTLIKDLIAKFKSQYIPIIQEQEDPEVKKILENKIRNRKPILKMKLIYIFYYMKRFAKNQHDQWLCSTHNLYNQLCSYFKISEYDSEHSPELFKILFTVNLLSDFTNITSIKMPADTSYIEDKLWNVHINNLANNTFYYLSNITSIDWRRSNRKAIFSCEYKSLNLKAIQLGDALEDIAVGAFQNCKITTIEIPSNVTKIGIGAFDSCTTLSSVTFRNNESSLEHIGEEGFMDCKMLTSFTIPKSVLTIGEKAFKNCSSLKDVYFEKEIQLKIIDLNLFTNCTKLNSITIPNSVKVIGEEAFSDCKELETVTFENESILESIRFRAFYRCGTLKAIKVPKSVQVIETEAFFYCKELETLNFVDHSELKIIQAKAFLNCKFNSITVPQFVQSIESEAFSNCSNLETVNFLVNSELKIIKDNAFKNCKLETISIPKGVKEIYYSVFSNCTALKTVTFNQDSVLKNIYSDTFSKCYALTTITIPKSVKYIGGCVFANCTSLTSVIFLCDELEYISSDFFLNCKKLIDITIPKSVKFIGGCVFANCTSLTSVIFLCDELEYISFKCFLNCKNLVNIAIPKNIEYIKNQAFKNCTKLVTITIPNSVTYIEDSVFENCTSLESVIFEGKSQLKTISSKCFSNCENLTEITIPESVNKIESEAFSGCKSLKKVIFEKDQIEIDPTAFSECDIALP